MSIAIDGPLSYQPFQIGSDFADNVAHTGTISLAGRVYVLDPTRGFTRETLEMRKASQDQGTTPGQQSLTDAGLWHRSQTDWSLGAGQAHFDRGNSNERRFHRSKGVNPWTPGDLSLLNQTGVLRVETEGNLRPIAVGGYVYWAAGSNLRACSNPQDASPTIATAAVGAQVRSLTSDGAYVYVATDAGVSRCLVGTTALAAFSTFAAQRIGYANGRLIATRNGQVVEIDAAGVAGGTGVLDFTHPNASWQWVSIASAPNAIYLAGVVGDRAEVYAILPNTDTGGLHVPVFADYLPYGETCGELCHYGDYMIYGTSRGFRLAQINSSSGALTHGPVVEIPGGVTAFAAQGEYVWFSWANYDSASTGLGRISLAELTAPLVPAYASDIMYTGQGQVTGAAVLGGHAYFGVAGVGIIRELADNLVTAGTVDGGKVSWNTFALKTVAAADVRHAPLTGVVVAQVIDEDETVVDAGRSSVTGSLGPDVPFPLSGSHGEEVESRVRLERQDATHGPVLHRSTLSAVVRPVRQTRYLLPLIITSSATDRDGVEHHYDTAAEVAFLKAVEATGQVVAQEVGADVQRVQINRIIQGGEQSVADWNDERTGFEGLVFVETITQVPGI